MSLIPLLFLLKLMAFATVPSIDIPARHEGAISDDIEVNYPQHYLETLTPDEGCLLPGYYHWDGKVVTFKHPLKESDEDWKMDDDE